MWRVWEWIGWAPERDDELPPQPLPFQPTLHWARCATQRINRTQHIKTLWNFEFSSLPFFFIKISILLQPCSIVELKNMTPVRANSSYINIIWSRSKTSVLWLFWGSCAEKLWCSKKDVQIGRGAVFRKLQLQWKDKMVSPVQRQNGKPSAESKGESKWHCAVPGCKACQISRECSEPAQ